MNKDKDKELEKKKKELSSLVNKARLKILFSQNKCRSFNEILGYLSLDKASPFLPVDTSNLNGNTTMDLVTYNLFANELVNNYIEYLKRPYEEATVVPSDVIISDRMKLLGDDSSKEEEDLSYISKDIREHPAWDIVPREYNEKQKAKLWAFQLRTSLHVVYKLWSKPTNYQGYLIISGTGTGKTFMAGQIIRWMTDNGWAKRNSLGPYKQIVITKANVVEQYSRVMKDMFGLRIPTDVLVTNYDQLRSKFGKRFLEERTEIVDGQPRTQFIWHEGIHPSIIYLDEIQAAKNEDSKQSQIIQALARLKDGKHFPIKVISMSATPFTRVCEAKAVVLTMKIPYDPWKITK